MGTFAQPRAFVGHPLFEADRKQALKKLVINEIGAPIRGIVEGFSRSPYCLTLQTSWRTR
jgi:hypothetical protein